MKNILFYNIGLIRDKLVLPYNWACLKTYAELDQNIIDNFNWLEPITHGNGIKQLQENFNLVEVDIVGLSCFAWNEEELNNVAILIKSMNPKCLVVIGGAQPDYSDEFYFKKHPYIDIIVKNEGEYAFYEILKEFINEKNYKDIPGIIFHDEDNEYMDTGSSVLIDNTEISPYIQQQEYFDNLIKNYVPAKSILNFESIVVPWETTRGCPYNCAYCKWDFSIDNKNNKMRQVSLERIQSEIEWFNTINKSWMLMGIDSNFGFFDRDLEITEYLCNDLSKDYFKLFYISRGRNVKNSNTIQTMLYENGLIRTNPIGIQHTDPDVINAMNRKSIDMTKILTNVPSVIHVILGSPMDNLDKWQRCMVSIVEQFGRGTEFMVYKYSIFNNTKSASKEYIDKYQIETINRLPQSYLKIKDDHLKFYFSNKFVVSTNTFDRDEWVKMYIFTIVMHVFFTSSIMTYITQYLKEEYEIELLEFYTSLFEYLLEADDTFLSNNISKCKDVLDNYVNNDYSYSSIEVEEIKDSDRMLKTEEYLLFKILFYSDEYRGEMADYLLKFFTDNVPIYTNDELDQFQDLIRYQFNSMVSYDYDYNQGRQFFSKYNWLDYFNGDELKLYTKDYKVITKHIGTNKRELFWHGKNEQQKIDKFIEVSIGSTYNRSSRGFLKDIIEID
jgi:tRNA A37 methylthiotransferase MiaB